MSESDAATERKAAQAARQAKLQAKAQERLAKITGAAPAGRVPTDGASRGETSELLQRAQLTCCTRAAAIGISPRPTPAATAPAPPKSLAAEDDDDPAEVDLALDPRSAQRQPGAVSPFAFPGAEAGGGFPGMGGEGGEDMFAQMMAQMSGGAAGGPGMAGMGGMFGAPGAQGGASPFGPPQSPFPLQPKSFLDRIFPLIHLLSMVALVLYAVGWIEPTRKLGAYGWMGAGGNVDWRAWGALAARKPAEAAGVVGKAVGLGLSEVVSVLLMFIKSYG